jgi:phosphate-selective porin OprO/OprP
VRLAPQGYLYIGPIGALGEYVTSTQPVTRGATTTTVSQSAWHVQLSWVITGEKASFEGVTPRHSLSVAEGHPGAIEVGARYHVLKVDDFAFPAVADTTKSARRATSFGAAVNWYPSRNFRVSVDFERTDFVGGAAMGNRASENALLGRAQVSF